MIRRFPRAHTGCLQVRGKHVVLRVALFADKKIEKMPHRVSFFWRWQMRQVAYNIPCCIIWHDYGKLFFNDFFSFIETYSENNYRCNTLKGVWEFHEFQFILVLSPFFIFTSLLDVKIGGFRSKTVFCYVIAQRYAIILIMSIYVFTTYILSVTARKSWIYVYLLVYLAYNSD